MNQEEINTDTGETLQEQIQAEINGSSPCSSADSQTDNASTQESEIARLNNEICTLKDLLQRRQADFENFRKRTAKMQEEYKKLSTKEIAYDILDINDDIIRA